MENSRRSLRVDCSVPVMLQIPGSKITESWGVIYDISHGGVRIETPTLLDRNQNIILSFVVAKKYHFKNLNGIVVRVLLEGHSYMVGIKFETVKDKKLLDDAIRSLEYIKQVNKE